MKNHDFVPKLLHNSNISSYFEAQFEDKTHSLTLNFHYKKEKANGRYDEGELSEEYIIE